MSVLVAVKRNNTVYMATDTREIYRNCKRNNLSEGSFKIQKQDNGMIVGITGDRIARQTLFANSDIFTLDRYGNLTKKHIIKNIIPQIIGLMRRTGLLVNKEDEMIRMGCDILLAHKGVMFHICKTFLTIRYEDFQAIGKASSSAEAVLFSTIDCDDVEDRMVKALDASSEYFSLVGAPYVLIDTKDLEYRVVKEEC